jgi:S-formylglutathione hydrolase FrmB
LCVQLTSTQLHAAWILTLLCASCRAPEAGTQIVSTTADATVTDVRFPCPGIGGILWYRAVVPTVAPGERLPVLYWLHGANSGAIDMEQHSEAVKFAVAERLIVIMPEAGNAYYTNARLRPRARWEDAMVSDLLHDAETRFPILPGREHRGIAGISMGGYGAVKLALKHPDLYSFAGSMSGAFDITRRRPTLRRPMQTLRNWTIFGVGRRAHMREDIFNLLDRSPHLQSTKWFLSCGLEDDFYPTNVHFLREMRAHGVPLEPIFTPGFHNWQTWTPTLPLLFKSAAEALR